ncbi:MAG: hypothetical protein AABX19_02340 [Nanoarchaeota archaeon]
MEKLTTEKLIAWSLIIIAFLIVFLWSTPAFGKLKVAIFGNSSSDAIEDKPISEIRNLFFDHIVSDYQSCKYSKDTNCYCAIRNTNIPNGFVVEIANINDNSIIKLHKAAAIAGGIVNDYSLSSSDSDSGISSIDVTIDDDKLFVENVAYGDPSMLPDTSLDIKDFLKVDKIYLESSTLYTTADLSGRNKIDFENGILYKKDQQRTFLLKKIDNLARCSSLPNVDKAINNFDSVTSSLNKCKSKNDEKCATYTPSLPTDYLLKAESGNLNIYYKNEKIKSANFPVSCILNSFNNPSRDLSGKFNTLLFNDYSTVDFYSYEDNSICIAVDDKIK